MKKCLLFVVMFITTAVFADQHDKWLDETVKVLITKEEKEAFKKLKTDSDKEKFIVEFWAKRDPSPGTPENEFKQQYEERLKRVNEKLKGDTKKAIDTDMGKAVLLLGDPSDSKKEESDPSRQTLIWKGVLPKEMGLGDVEIKFEGDPEEGGFVFSDPKATNQLLDKARNYLANLKSTAQAQAPAPTEQAAPVPVPPPTSGPVKSPEVKAALDAAAAGNAAKDVQIEAIGDSFMSSTGELYASVAAKSSASQNSKVGIRIVDAAGAVVKETELPLASANEKPGNFATSITIPSGEYSLIVAIVDGDKSGVIKKPLSVPDYKSQFSLSSVVFMRDFQQLAQHPPEMTPYTFGKTKVVPSLDGVVPKTGNLEIIYEIYNATADEKGQSKVDNLEESIRFERTGGNPKQTKPQTPQGFPLGKKIAVPNGYPLATFEPGEYKMIITITDKTTNQTAKRETTFKVQ